MAAEDQAQELLMRAGEAGVRIVVDVCFSKLASAL